MFPTHFSPMLVILLGLIAASSSAPPDETKPNTRSAAAPRTSQKTRAEPLVPAWAELLEARPPRGIVTDARLLAAIEKTGFAWRVRDRVSGIEMLLVPPGHYMRGKSKGDAEALYNEEPAHIVYLTQPFYLSRYELQVHEWDHAIDGEPLTKTKGPPRSGLDLGDVQKFLDVCNSQLREGPDLMRLPTEAEWEFACRAGTDTPRYAADIGEIAWYAANSKNEPQPVGGKKANALGFHDMLGNVWEWCADGFDPDEYRRVARDPKLATDPIGVGGGRSLRGGAYQRPAAECRASFRGRNYAEPRTRPYGLRAARTAIIPERNADDPVK